LTVLSVVIESTFSLVLITFVMPSSNESTGAHKYSMMIPSITCQRASLLSFLLCMLMLSASCQQESATKQTDQPVADIYDLIVNVSTTRSELERMASEVQQSYGVYVDYSATQFDESGFIQFLDLSLRGVKGTGGKSNADRSSLGEHDYGFRIERLPTGAIEITNIMFVEDE